MAKKLKEPPKKESSKQDVIERLKMLLSKGEEIPSDLGNYILDHLATDLEDQAQKKHNGRKKKKRALSDEEVEKQLALRELVIKNKASIVEILESEKNLQKVRVAGHFVDNKLKYSTPEKNTDQLDMFQITERPRNDVHMEQVDYAVSAPGIHLSPPENKLISALIKLLNDKSETYDVESKKYFKGNYFPPTPSKVRNYGGTGEDVQTPVIRVKPSELYKAYLDDKNYSGAEIQTVKNLIESLAKKNHMIFYERKRKIVNNKGQKETRTDVIKDFQPLFRVLFYTPDLTDEELANYKKNSRENVSFEQKGEYILALNPILVDQIDQKYVEYPRDIEKQTSEAAGGPRKVTEADIALRDWILRELSNNRTVFQVNEDKLAYMLKLHAYIQHRRKKMIQKKIDHAIEVCKKLGILDKVEAETGSKGQMKFIFYLSNPYK